MRTHSVLGLISYFDVSVLTHFATYVRDKQYKVPAWEYVVIISTNLRLTLFGSAATIIALAKRRCHKIRDCQAKLSLSSPLLF